MGRAMLIICAGLLVALGYTFLGVAGRRQTMTKRNVTTYNFAKAKNTAHTGIQIAIQKYNDDSTWTGPETVTYEDASLRLSLQKVNTDTISVTSKSSYQGTEHTVISTFDISQKQQLVPDFAGALSGVGSNKNINFQHGNGKVHFDGHPPAGTPCSDKPGFTVQDPSMVSTYSGLSEIDGNPSVATDNNIKYNDITDLIDALAPQATTIRDGDEFTEQPGVYFITDYTHLSGKTSGKGILVVRNNAILDIESELAVSGQFEFDGLVIFENGSNFQGTGKAQFKGTVVAASNDNSTFNIKANGNFNAQYDCTAKKYADQSVNNLLNTTIYKQLSVYE